MVDNLGRKMLYYCMSTGLSASFGVEGICALRLGLDLRGLCCLKGDKKRGWGLRHEPNAGRA